MNPIQYSDLRDIDDVHGFNESDAACLKEIEAVLMRHDRSDRFGIALLHKHFDLNDDEVLLEMCDTEARTLTLRPVQRSTDLAQRAVATIWTCGGVEAQKCTRQCVKGSDGKHYGYKEHL